MPKMYMFAKVANVSGRILTNKCMDVDSECGFKQRTLDPY